MANLFFVHTPLQMLVAQQLIHANHLSDNILLYGYIDDHKYFLRSFELLSIDELWSHKIFYPRLPAFADLSHRFPVKGFINTCVNSKRIGKLIKQYNVDQIYFGDIMNITYQFGMKYFHKYCSINIYEEGTSHYVSNARLPLNRHAKWLQKIVLDSLFYLPLFHFRFAAYWFKEGSYASLPIDRRYSIVPGYNKEKFDKLLPIDFSLISEKTHSYLEKETQELKQYTKKEFLITSKVYEHQSKSLRDGRYAIYKMAIEEFIASLSSDTILVIKLHPREEDDVKSDIQSIADKYHIKSLFLSKQIVLPCELYLQIIQPSRITMFMNSTAFYNGYMYPKCVITDLTERYIELCEQEHVDVAAYKASYSVLR
jgi:hypothetical protein